MLTGEELLKIAVAQQNSGLHYSSLVKLESKVGGGSSEDTGKECSKGNYEVIFDPPIRETVDPETGQITYK